MKLRVRKRYQKKLHRDLKQANRMLKTELPAYMYKIPNRFSIREKCLRWYDFVDCEDGLLTVGLEMTDHYTGYSKVYYVDYAPWRKTWYWILDMEVMNDFVNKATENE